MRHRRSISLQGKSWHDYKFWYFFQTKFSNGPYFICNFAQNKNTPTRTKYHVKRNHSVACGLACLGVTVLEGKLFKKPYYKNLRRKIACGQCQWRGKEEKRNPVNKSRTFNLQNLIIKRAQNSSPTKEEPNNIQGEGWQPTTGAHTHSGKVNSFSVDWTSLAHNSWIHNNTKLFKHKFRFILILLLMINYTSISILLKGKGKRVKINRWGPTHSANNANFQIRKFEIIQFTIFSGFISINLCIRVYC